MISRFLADLVVALHFAFILFALFGGLLGLRWPRALFAHAPAALWAALIEFCGWPCPLTPLETLLRTASGASGYRGGFVEHYLVPLIYPPGLTPEIQLVLGGLVIAVNGAIYLAVWRRPRRWVP